MNKQNQNEHNNILLPEQSLIWNSGSQNEYDEPQMLNIGSLEFSRLNATIEYSKIKMQRKNMTEK